MRDRSERADDQDNWACSVVHLPLTQTPTATIVAMTATTKIPRSTVYSINAAPSSSLLSRRTSFGTRDILVPLQNWIIAPPPGASARGSRYFARESPLVKFLESNILVIFICPFMRHFRGQKSPCVAVVHTSHTTNMRRRAFPSSACLR